MKKDEAEKDLQLALYALACREVPELRALGDVSELVYMYPRHLAHGRAARREQTVTPDLAERTRAADPRASSARSSPSSSSSPRTPTAPGASSRRSARATT